jgi:membrane protein implicated in regulation of membrane protease activity
MTDFLWVLWLAVAIAAAIGEVVTLGLFLAAFAAAAVITAIVAIVVPSLALQVGVFGALSLLGLGVFRPIALNALGWQQAEQITGPVSQSHLMNKRAVVTKTVDNSGGQIRIGEGEFWSARSFDPSDVMEPGAQVEVVLVDGLTALVSPVVRPIQEIDDQAPIEKGI